MIRVAALVIIGAVAIAGANGTAARENFVIASWIVEAEELLESVDDYTAVFHRQARVRGELKTEETMLLKFKKPFKIYLKWIEYPYKGRELLYVDGENKNFVKVHGGGLLSPFTLNLDPYGSLFMRCSRHTITEVGIHYITKFIGGEFRRGIDRGEIEIINRGEEIVFGRNTMKIEGVFPQKGDEGYYCHRAVVNIDLETKIPINIEVYDWANELFEYYGFENLVLNAGLGKDDFDPKNAHYRF
jgi:hypothetical protein